MEEQEMSWMAAAIEGTVTACTSVCEAKTPQVTLLAGPSGQFLAVSPKIPLSTKLTVCVSTGAKTQPHEFPPLLFSVALSNSRAWSKSLKAGDALELG